MAEWLLDRLELRLPKVVPPSSFLRRIVRVLPPRVDRPARPPELSPGQQELRHPEPVRPSLLLRPRRPRLERPRRAVPGQGWLMKRTCGGNNDDGNKRFHVRILRVKSEMSLVSCSEQTLCRMVDQSSFRFLSFVC